MGKSKNFDVMSFLQSYSQSLSRKIIVNSEFYDVLTLTSVTRICALLLPWLLQQPRPTLHSLLQLDNVMLSIELIYRLFAVVGGQFVVYTCTTL